MGRRLGTRERIILHPLPYMGGNVQGKGYVLERRRVRDTVSPAKIRICEQSQVLPTPLAQVRRKL